MVSNELEWSMWWLWWCLLRSSYVGGGSHLYSTQQMLASIISLVAVSLVSLDPHVMM